MPMVERGAVCSIVPMAQVLYPSKIIGMTIIMSI